MKPYDTLLRHKAELVLLILISLLYVSLIAFWARGKLLFGGDSTGFYNIYDFLQLPSASSFFWALSDLISFGNLSIMFYLHLFFDTFLATSGIYVLSRLLFSSIRGVKGIAYGVITSVLFLFNPWSVFLTYLSLTGDVGLGVAGFTFFLVGIVMYMERNIPHDVKRYSPIISGIGLGISLPPFPNYIRLSIVVAGIFLICIIILLVENKTRSVKSLLSFVAFALIVGAIGIILSIEYFIPIVSSIHSTLAGASSGAADHAYLGFYTGQFNNILNELRGINSWAYPGIFYYHWYETINILSLVTYLWPILALLLPLYLVELNAKGKTIFFIIVLMVVVFWDKGQNPPLGFLWTSINQHLPMGYQLIPTSYLSGLFLDRLYPILASLSIILIYEKISAAKVTLNAFFRRVSRGHLSGFLSRNRIAAVATIILVLLLVASAFPAFIGDAETYTYNGTNMDNAGFYIPNAYQYARTYLIFEDHNNGSVLLMPPTNSNPYFSTSWGFSGYIGFYAAFFAPVKVITLGNFGGTYANKSQVDAYFNLTEPLIINNSTGQFYLPQTYIELLKRYNISYIMLDSSINSGMGTTYNYSLKVISILLSEHVIKRVLNLSPLSIYALDFQTISNNTSTFHPDMVGQRGISIDALNKNATLSNRSYFADAGNVVQFTDSINSTASWFISGSFIASGRVVNITFSRPGIYNVSAMLKYNNMSVTESINYTVAPKMVPTIYLPSTLEVGKVYFLTGGVSGGTIFPDREYNWRWYINGVYQRNIGDRNYLVPLSFNKTGTYIITLVVTDGLGERAYLNMTVNVDSKLLYAVEQNMTVGTIFYLVVFLSLLYSAATYLGQLKMKEGKEYESHNDKPR